MAPPVTAFSSAFRTPLPAFSAAAATTEVPEPEPEVELVPEGGGVFADAEPCAGVMPEVLPPVRESIGVECGVVDPKALFKLAAIVESPADADEDVEGHAVAEKKACSV